MSAPQLNTYIVHCKVGLGHAWFHIFSTTENGARRQLEMQGYKVVEVEFDGKAGVE